MKYVIVLGDGMADEPIEAAGGKTPLQLADKPVMDEMAKVSEQGIAYTVPSNFCLLYTSNLRQVVTAVSDGANCVYSVERYLQNA